MKGRVAAVIPESFWGDEEYRNSEMALQYLEEAAKGGAHLVCFPEGYPGPCHGPMDSGGRLREKPIETLRAAARERGVYVSASDLEENPAVVGTYFLTHKLISPLGKVLCDYRRVQPDHPPLNGYLMSGRKHIIPGHELPVVETEVGRIAPQICSELFVPELSRIQMLRGADIIIAPANGVHSRTSGRLADTWHCIARARAAENLVYVVVAHNVFSVAGELFDMGTGIVAGPEGVLAVSQGPGILYADLDLDRLNWLRGRDIDEETLRRPADSKAQPRGTRPGQIYDRRPDLYGPLVEPQPEAWDYFYFCRGLDAWEESYRDGWKVKSS